MRSAYAILAALPLLAFAPSASAAGTPGPFAGLSFQGDVDTFAYDNNPGGWDCIALAAPYAVLLRYAPASDSLTLAVDGYLVASGSNGEARLEFSRGVCAAFTIEVEGTAVASLAVFEVTVLGGVAASGGGAVQNLCNAFAQPPPGC